MSAVVNEIDARLVLVGQVAPSFQQSFRDSIRELGLESKIEILDPVEPEHVSPAFKMVFRHLQRGKALAEMVFVEGHYLLALDGTGYFSSQEIHCESCLETHHRNGTVTYSHQLLGAAFIHPDKREVIPLMPDPIVKQDGSEKNGVCPTFYT